mgnify:CR=1 FL=1
MRKWSSVILLMLISSYSWAVENNPASDQQEKSSIAMVALGTVLLILIAFVLYRKQKRKFND